jgi:hypothetical protein
MTFSDMCATYGIGGMVNWFGWTLFEEQVTGEDGKFVFKNLPYKNIHDRGEILLSRVCRKSRISV